MSNMTQEQWQQLQDNINDFLQSGAGYIVTLNTRETLRHTDLAEIILKFERQLNRKIYGTKWRTKGTQLGWGHNLEHKNGNSHSHSILAINDDVSATDVKRHSRHIWKKLNRFYKNTQAQIYIKEIEGCKPHCNHTTDCNRKAAIVYALKGGAPLSAKA